MKLENISKILIKLSEYIANINRLLKNIKLNTVANFIYLNSRNITITTNNIAVQSNLDIIEKYIKNIDSIHSKNISFS